MKRILSLDLKVSRVFACMMSVGSEFNDLAEKLKLNYSKNVLCNTHKKSNKNS